MRIKVKDIAQNLELSPATVSMVLNGKPGISQRTRDRVLNYMRDMECQEFYIPQDAGKSILFLIYQKHGVNASGALYFSQIFSEMIGVIEKQIRRNHYNLSISYLSQENFLNEIKGLVAKEYSGILVLGTELTSEQLRILSQCGIPMVIVDNYEREMNVDAVTVDNERGVFQALSYLKSLGHTQIGYLHVCQNANNFSERYYAFQKCQQILKLESCEKYVYGIYTEDIFEELKKLIRIDDMPTAFFADNDIVAASAIRLLREWGYMIPQDISIVGFDNMAFAEMLDPPLTTIEVSKQKLGVVAANTILENIRQSSEENMRVQIGTKLVVRESAALRKE